MEPEKVEKVTVGKVTTRKKPLGRRFAETFFGGDAQGVMQYVVRDVILPAVKDVVVDAISSGVERWVFGGDSPRRPRSSRFGSTPYTAYSTPVTRPSPTTQYQTVPARAVSQQARAAHNFDEIILASRVEAETVLNRLNDRVIKYEQATVNDLYDLVGIAGDFTAEKYGWTSLEGSAVRRLRNDQYLLIMPPTVQLD
jgi:hypothetical protein